MTGAKILITGDSITTDKELLQAVAEIADIEIVRREEDIADAAGRDSGIRLVLLSSDEHRRMTQQLDALAQGYHDVPVLFIGDRKLMATAFAHGVRDAFPHPVNHKLLTERIKALLREE